MILEILDLAISSILTAAAVKIAHSGNSISKKTIKIESDKLLIEWGQRTLQCLSETTSLRLMTHTETMESEFKSSRRVLRARLFALMEEGSLFFTKAAEQDSTSVPALDAIKSVSVILNGRTFCPPKENDFDKVRAPQVSEIRKYTRAFIRSLQEQVGTAWLSDRGSIPDAKPRSRPSLLRVFPSGKPGGGV